MRRFAWVPGVLVVIVGLVAPKLLDLSTEASWVIVIGCGLVGGLWLVAVMIDRRRVAVGRRLVRIGYRLAPPPDPIAAAQEQARLDAAAIKELRELLASKEAELALATPRWDSKDLCRLIELGMEAASHWESVTNFATSPRVMNNPDALHHVQQARDLRNRVIDLAALMDSAAQPDTDNWFEIQQAKRERFDEGRQGMDGDIREAHGALEDALRRVNEAYDRHRPWVLSMPARPTAVDPVEP